MPFSLICLKTSGDHRWAVCRAASDPGLDNDKLTERTIQALRDAYGEKLLTVDIPAADPTVEERFNLDAIRKAIRKGLPDPSKEGKKPEHLKNYRSETAELLAKEALAFVHDVDFPTSPQMTKGNANQPILGFDGWGILEISAGVYALVLVQVKGTDENKRPPGEAAKLLTECIDVPTDAAKLCRALSSLSVLLKDTNYFEVVMKMLEVLGEDNLPNLIVAPVLVRGKTLSCMKDLENLESNQAMFAPADARGLSLSIGTDLTDFAKIVVTRATKS